MRSSSVVLFCICVGVTFGFRMPVNRLVSSKKSPLQKSKVEPLFLADYKSSIAPNVISLDKPSFPTGNNHGGVLLAAALSFIVIQNFNYLKESLLHLTNLLPNSNVSFLQGLFQRLKNPFKRVKEVNSDWNKCSLQTKELLSDKFVQYRFTADPEFLSHSMSQVELCIGDSKANAQLETFNCFNYPSKGYFDVIEDVRSDSSILSSLSDGDEVAFSAKDFVLTPSASQKSFFMFTIGLGIVSTLQVVQQILSQSEAEVYLLWTNPTKADFILNNFVKALESVYPQRFTVSRIVDESASNDRSSSYSERLKKGVLSFELGRVGTIFVPKREVNKARSLMSDLNYPEDSVLVCDT